LTALPRAMPPLGGRQATLADAADPQALPPRDAAPSRAQASVAESEEATPVSRPRPRPVLTMTGPAPRGPDGARVSPGIDDQPGPRPTTTTTTTATMTTPTTTALDAPPSPPVRTVSASAARRAVAPPTTSRLVLDAASAAQQWTAMVVDAVLLAGVELLLVRATLGVLGIRPSAQALIDAFHGSPTRLLPVVVVALLGLLLGHAGAVVLGASPGQRLLGLRLVDTSGSPPARPRLMVRAVLGALGMLLFLAGPAFALFLDRQRRGPADVLVGTVAVRR
jgi:uncharacterized RDD family membrane protein YckC